MAIVQVQNNSARSNATSQLAVVFPSDVTAGNSIVAATAHNQSSVVVTDNQSNPYTLDKRLLATRRAEIHHSSDVAGGGTTVTFTPNVNADIGGCILEYDKNLELDQAESASQASGTSHPCGSFTTTVADEVIVTASRSFSAYSGSPASGYSEVAELSREYFQERITTATETTDGAWTSVDSEDVTSVMCSYNEVSVGGNAMPMAMNHYRRRRTA